MRIVYLGTNYPSAISPMGMRTEVEELRRRGVTIDAFSIREPPPETVLGETMNAARKRTHYLYRSPVELLISGLIGLVRFFHRIPRAVARIRRTRPGELLLRIKHGAYLLEAASLARNARVRGAQLIHAHGGENPAFVAALAASLSGLPYSLSLHGPDGFSDPERWGLADRIANAAFTACISEFCEAQCSKLTSPEHVNRLQVIRSCPPPEMTVPPVPVPEDTGFLCVCRLVPEKGLSDLLDALSVVVGRGGSVTLTIVGDGPDRGAIESAIERLGLSTTVSIRGWADPLSIRDLLDRSRALVLPSHAEGLPAVIVEAFSRARPVIATDVAGVPELVEVGVSGWLVRPGRVQQLAQAVEEASNASTDRLNEMGHAGRRAVGERHDLGEEISRLMQCFASVIER